MLKLAIQRPIAVTMLFTALVLIGILSYQRLPVDLLPSITYPRLTVITTYEDIPAEDLERLVTRPLEEELNRISDLKTLSSRSVEGFSSITAFSSVSRLRRTFSNLATSTTEPLPG